MGFSGNVVPQFIIPTQLCYNTKPKLKEMADLDFYIGEEAVEKAAGDYQITFPMKHGQVENWDNMERFWEHCFFKYLRTEPENHYVMLVCFSLLIDYLGFFLFSLPLTFPFNLDRTSLEST